MQHNQVEPHIGSVSYQIIRKFQVHVIKIQIKIQPVSHPSMKKMV